MKLKALERQTLINLLEYKGIFYMQCKRKYLSKKKQSNSARITSRITKRKEQRKGLAG